MPHKKWRCARCDAPIDKPKPLGYGLAPVTVCTHCMLLHVVREMGELSDPDDRANPDEWGPACL